MNESEYKGDRFHTLSLVDEELAHDAKLSTISKLRKMHIRCQIIARASEILEARDAPWHRAIEREIGSLLGWAEEHMLDYQELPKGDPNASTPQSHST